MSNICANYCGITCVNGNCPVALADKYAEHGLDVIHSCNDCIYREGCDDCYFFGSEICDMGSLKGLI